MDVEYHLDCKQLLHINTVAYKLVESSDFVIFEVLADVSDFGQLLFELDERLDRVLRVSSSCAMERVVPDHVSDKRKVRYVVADLQTERRADELLAHWSEQR